MGTKLDDGAKVIVCAKCLRACCWYGQFMCDEATGADIKTLAVAELRKLDREHEDHWSDETMIEMYGTADRDFRI